MGPQGLSMPFIGARQRVGRVLSHLFPIDGPETDCTNVQQSRWLTPEIPLVAGLVLTGPSLIF